MRTDAIAALLLACAAPAAAQQPPSAEAALEAQRAAMEKLSFLDGHWRGPAWRLTPAGRRDLVQTERAGPFLGGAVRVIEGRGYEADGRLAFNAFGIVSFDPATRAYTLRAYAEGQKGDFPFELTPTGYVWTVPAGPGRQVRYTGTVRGDTLREVGELVSEGAAPVQIFEMNLKRVGDGAWPADGAVLMR